ncbi:MAG: hypothetical protein VKO39_04810 [Cyanobacteriota bacterium]|nr:hypothetical protein [Cyanobacteriota bacterium]
MDNVLGQGDRDLAHGRRWPGCGSRAVRVVSALALLLVTGWGGPGQSQSKRYDPDKDTCQVEAIRRAYQANLLPWADQPEVVLQRLRQLQAAMTLDTLRECQARELLSPTEAASLDAELGLKATAAASKDAPAEPAQSPTRP